MKERSSRVGPDASRKAPLSNEVDRADRGAGEDRGDGLELSQDERDQMLRDDALQNMLPTPPKRPGIHYFYANMIATGGATISWYKRLGYRLVRFDEMKGWAEANMRCESGEYAGCITIREMVLMQCAEADYQRFMKIVHHDKPNDESRRVADMVQAMKSEVGEGNLRGVAGPGETDGFTLLERQTKVKRPAGFE